MSKDKKYNVSLNPSMALSYSFKGIKYEAGKSRVVTGDKVDYFLKDAYFHVTEIGKSQVDKKPSEKAKQPVKKATNPEEKGEIVVERCEDRFIKDKVVEVKVEKSAKPTKPTKMSIKVNK